MDHVQPQQIATRWNPDLLHDLNRARDRASAAGVLADAGIPVFPCRPGMKEPLTSHGFHDASADPDRVGSWWRHWPQANIGLPTGATSGVDVVDVDVHASASGYKAFDRARAAGLLDGWAWTVRTPSTGLHAYFLRGDGGEQRSWQVPRAHIDFRGDGGYVVIPPSRVRTATGEVLGYELAEVTTRTPRGVDAGALRAFLDPPRTLRPLGGLVGAPHPGTRPDRLAAWVASRPEGGRNHALFWAACRLAEDGQRLDVAESLLGDAARIVGLPDREALTTIRSAYRTATRSAPPDPARSAPAVKGVGL